MDCPFIIEDDNEVAIFIADPDCQAGHDYFLAELGKISPFFLLPGVDVSSRIKGNIGEFMSFCVGRDQQFAEHNAFPVNALNPLKDISSSEIDILWVYFDTVGTNDKILVQEVKTTGDSSLGYAARLVSDYDKLFGTEPALTLQTRIWRIKNELEFSLKRPDLARRISRLVGISPSTSPRVKLIPTLVHEKVGSDPLRKMLAVRETLIGRGWGSEAIQPWAISLTDLDERIERIAHGQG